MIDIIIIIRTVELSLLLNESSLDSCYHTDSIKTLFALYCDFSRPTVNTI